MYALGYLESTIPFTLQTFVANKVSDIQKLTDNIYLRHVSTKQNSEKQVSQGFNVDELNNSIWFGGTRRKNTFAK